jgi:hypothetical protein
MSPPGRPKGEFPRPEAEGSPVSPPGRPKGEFPRPEAEGSPMSPPGRAARAPAPAPLAWVGTLVEEMDRRMAAQVAAMRGSATEPALKNLVITDAEVDALLARGPQDGAATLPPGSLAEQVVRSGGDSALRVLVLQQRFGLSGFELDVVLACLVLDIERRFERLYAYLNDDLTRARPSVDVLVRLLVPGRQRVAWQAALTADAPLLRLGVLVADDAGRSAQPDLFRVADGVSRFLLERDGVDARLARLRSDDDVPPLAPRLWQRRGHAAALAAVLARRTPRAAALLVHVQGRDAGARRFAVESACAQVQLGCLVLDGRKLRRSGSELEAVLVAALRDALLRDAVLLVDPADACMEDADRQADLRAALQPWLRGFPVVVAFGCEAALPLAAWFPATPLFELPLPLPDMAEREDAWTEVLAGMTPLAAAPRAALAQALAVKFRTSDGEIAAAAQQACNERAAAAGTRAGGAAAAGGAAGDASAEAAAWSRALHAVAGRVTAPRLHQLAEAMAPTHDLRDLVLPPDKADVLHDIVRRVRHRRTVLENWGFDAVSARGRGLVALFHGASGTGKTMAADAIACSLHMQLFRIDLAGVVSKYIGETEKNLRAIFDEADRADAVLFFDEADALFGKRSEVKDAHDRYANIEINYLLQRIEMFEGIAILATNKRSHLDEAFLRRIHVTLEFPLPRAAERVQLWDRSFPQAAPLAGDIDWDFLAQRFDLTGGAIRNAALGAAYLAAEAGRPIGMREVVNALRTELVKVGRRVQDSEFAPHAQLLALAAAPLRPVAAPMRRPAVADPTLAATEE